MLVVVHRRKASCFLVLLIVVHLVRLRNLVFCFGRLMKSLLVDVIDGWMKRSEAVVSDARMRQSEVVVFVVLKMLSEAEVVDLNLWHLDRECLSQKAICPF